MKYEKVSIEDHCTRHTGARANVILMCEVRQGLRPWALARLEDISSSGFRIVWLPGCDPELPVRIRIPGLRVLKSSVRWQQGNAVGCQFDQPLHVAVFEHIVKRAQIG